jgi:hypothetical protein
MFRGKVMMGSCVSSLVQDVENAKGLNDVA